jgi:hypothetical protein
MSANPTALNLALQPFVEAGFQVSVTGDFLIVHDIPYVANGPTLKKGKLITTFMMSGDQIVPPNTHQVWFQGEFPRMSNGELLMAIGTPESTAGDLGQGVTANYFFSSKPLKPNWSRYETHLEQIQHYDALMTYQARAFDPNAGRREIGKAVVHEILTPFQYPDASSLRGAYVATTERLALKKTAIIGLGGTGSYVLDQVAKTPSWEIHLFDGDVFEMHNAFRAPGAAEQSDFGILKTEYFYREYSAMHKGVIPHGYYITKDNLHNLDDFDFVFICVDRGPARKMISEYLRQKKIPFVDCGMDLKIDKKQSGSIYGQCRATLCTPQQEDHFDDCAPFMEEGGDALYGDNIQIADMNVINAMLAVTMWKQYCGFYVNQMHSHNQVYTVNQQALTRSVYNEGSKREAEDDKS